MELILGFITPYVYPDIILLVITFTQLFKTFFCKKGWLSKVNPKWITLGVSIIFFIVGFLNKATVFTDGFNPVKYLLTFGITVLAYDYVLKPFLDIISKKSAFTEPPKDETK